MFSMFSNMELSPYDAARLRRVEQELDVILRHLGLEYDDPGSRGDLPDEVRRLADDGRKIHAIKAHRELTGSDLRDAKQAVEAYLGRT